MDERKICIPVSGGTADVMIDQIRRACELADVVEVRFDCLESGELPKTLAAISEARFETPLIATYRSPEQGGQGNASLADRRVFWAELPEGYWGVDQEADVFGTGPDVECRIASFHDFDGVPDDIQAVYRKLAATSDIVKIAVRTEDATDAIPLWNLIARAKAEGKRLIPIAMGDAGKWTRILGPAHGAMWTYASLEAGGETAPGQIAATDMTGVFRVRELDERTQVFAVLGDPIAQSMSPYMHNPAFASSGINAVFLSLLVRDIEAFFRRMVRAETREAELNFGGFSVTMPHKQSIMPLLDAIEPTAAKIGAVNTVKIDGGRLTGYNTDAHGFITPLKAKFGDLRGARVAVCGAGGAARACVYSLQQEDAQVTVFARDGGKAAAFAAEFGVKHAQLTADHRELATEVDILVDTTPLGMKGPLENETLLTADQLKGVKLVYDLVTKPTDTPIIREAKLAGADTIGGVDMLIAQGAMQFEIWTGRAAPLGLIRESVARRFAQLNK